MVVADCRVTVLQVSVVDCQVMRLGVVRCWILLTRCHLSGVVSCSSRLSLFIFVVGGCGLFTAECS
jgi:hypothetical protein